MGAFDSARSGSARAATPLSLYGAAALVAALAACFKPDYFDYAACATTESCRDGGLDACVLLPDVPGQPGFCAAHCGDDGACPAGQDGDARPVCLTVEGAGVCALDCGEQRTCPTGYVCRDVRDMAQVIRATCFPGPGETP